MPALTAIDRTAIASALEVGRNWIKQNKQATQVRHTMPTLQKVIYDELLKVRFPDDLENTFRRRLLKFFPEAFESGDAIDFRNLREFVCQLPVAIAQQCLRCWANAWTTSTRMQEATSLPALCGCSLGADAWQHYIECGSLWYLLAAIDHLPLAGCPIERLALRSPTIRSVLRLTALSGAYHAIRAQHEKIVTSAIACGNRKVVFKLWADLLTHNFIAALARPDMSSYRRSIRIFSPTSHVVL